MQASELVVSHGASKLAAAVPESIVLVTFSEQTHGIERNKLKTQRVRQPLFQFGNPARTQEFARMH